MDIILDNLNEITNRKYISFRDEVNNLLKKYKETDRKRFDLVEERLKHTNGNWDTVITLISNGKKEDIEISKLLAYEYCLAGEKVTNGRVSFEDMLDKLFTGVTKFRIGNPIPGLDDECLYSKALDDENGVPVTSKLYRMIMNAGAQHLDYVSNGELIGAVFIYKKGIIENIAIDDNGKALFMRTDGIDFDDLSYGQSLLTNLRQTAFHEWNHNAEKDIIKPNNSSFLYEYQGLDGKIYRNYSKLKDYVYTDLSEGFREPTYVISEEIDERGNKKRYHINEFGKRRPLSEVRFGLKRGSLDKEVCVSQGLSTLEIFENGKTRMHNIITEGFVEKISRDMVRAVDPFVKDIDEGKYPEYVEIARQVILARDKSLGENEDGQTIADFLSSSSVLKHDLESRTVILDDGTKVDGLHYIADYADNVQNGNTRKAKFFRAMPSIAKSLGLTDMQIRDVRNLGVWIKRKLTKEDIIRLKEKLLVGDKSKEEKIDEVIAEFVDILESESMFFDNIGMRLGYTKRAKEKSTMSIAKEAIEGLSDLSFLDEIENAEEKQAEDIKSKSESKNKDNSKN